MALGDVLVAAAILAGALWLLVRTVRRAGASGCHGCSGACRGKPAGAGGLVSIGHGSPKDGRGDHPTSAGSGYIESSSAR